MIAIPLDWDSLKRQKLTQEKVPKIRHISGASTHHPTPGAADKNSIFSRGASNDQLTMKDWASPIIAVALFAFLTPGLIFQLPGKQRPVDFMNMKTSMPSIVVHAIMFGVLITLFLVILHVHLNV
ncbi:hypothetical protein Taro_039534 [Colocasia esculenta]|uniref:Transmembrane protein n=1 Tax=Colocasia esculenta TaxID=4460 RepID=A0A843WGV4_COLES|nr:hypothetical protein [Colocasia esculenta]